MQAHITLTFYPFFPHKNKLCYFTMKSDKTSNTWTKPKWHPKYYINKCSSHYYKMHFLYEIVIRAQDVFDHMLLILTIIKYVILHCDTVHYLYFHGFCPSTQCPKWFSLNFLDMNQTECSQMFETVLPHTFDTFLHHCLLLLHSRPMQFKAEFSIFFMCTMSN